MAEERIHWSKVLIVTMVTMVIVALAVGFFVLYGRRNEQKTDDIKVQWKEQEVWVIKDAADLSTIIQVSRISDDLLAWHEVPGQDGLGGDFHINKSLTKAYNLIYFTKAVHQKPDKKTRVEILRADPNARVKRATVMTFCLPKTNRRDANNWKAKVVKIDDYSGSWESLINENPGSAGFFGS